jgi:hypothetical protein
MLTFSHTSAISSHSSSTFSIVFIFFHASAICSQPSFTFSIHVHILSHPHYMFTIFFNIQHMCSRCFAPRLYVHNLLSHSVCLFVHILSHPDYMFTIFLNIQCSHCYVPRPYVHNLLSHSVHMFTFFHTPGIYSHSSFTLNVNVDILLPPVT